MSRVPTVRQVDLNRILRALKDNDLIAGRIEVRPGGEVIIIPASSSTQVSGPADELERWRQERARRAAQRT